MSDIYLQITETPTVVTLSAPVVSGALASTVTVANTVTVALDSNSLSALENVTVTLGAAITGTVTVSNFPATQPVSIASVTIGNTVTIAGTVTANPTGTQTIAGTVTANVPNIQVCTQGNFAQTSAIQTALGVINQNNISQVLAVFGSEAVDGEGTSAFVQVRNQISGTVTIGSALPAGTNLIGVVTIGAGTVTIGAGTAQIGSVTASISGTVPISIASVTVGNSVTIGSLPAISGTVTANLGSYPTYANGRESLTIDLTGVRGNDSALWLRDGGGNVPISGTVTANTFALQGTAVTTSNFTSTTASTVLANYNATREVLTIFNEGAGNLHICAGATCTTIAYQVRLSAGDYYEVPNHQTTITHSGVFATAGTARVTEVS